MRLPQRRAAEETADNPSYPPKGGRRGSNTNSVWPAEPPCTTPVLLRGIFAGRSRSGTSDSQRRHKCANESDKHREFEGGVLFDNDDELSSSKKRRGGGGNACTTVRLVTVAA